ncbi:MAG: oligoendopeptidase F [Candidatus Obscuribacterales bacterium]|nr:oligoendopeptidase F [Candidatus Obscuribacterales bacterium]
MTTASTLPKRADVPEALTWDLTPIYASEAEWERDFAHVSGQIPTLASYKGRLRRSGRLLLEFLTRRDAVYQVYGKVSTYAHLHGDTDTKNAHYQELNGRVRDLGNKISTALAWVNPELLSIKPARLDGFVQRYKGLEIYRRDFDELNRERAHFRSSEVEEVLSEAGPIFGASGAVFGMFNNADLKLPELDDETGNRLRMTNGNWTPKWMENPDRATRKRAYEAMFDSWLTWRNTLAAIYNGQVKADVFGARVRKYKSCRQQALSGIEVPETVYDSLVQTVHANLPHIHRYLELRKRILGVDELAWYDMYVPLVGEFKYKITYPEAQQKVLAAVQPLGAEYVDTLRGGFNSRWTDVVESEGKRSGAYSSGTWGTAPYMLLNWHDSLDSMFTLAHEAGHSMHSWHSKRRQPYPTSDYTLFVAEVASTLNEALLAHYLIAETDDKAMKRFIINKQMESIRSTLVRQTMFAEFEMIAHATAEEGKPLTADVLCGIHKGLNEKYYGAVVKLDDRIGIEWARIPHFYRSFYVYQYSTGISAALTLARRIIKEGKPAVERYLNFLSGGSSMSSIDLLKNAGVDLTTPQPIQAAFDSFVDYLDQFEKLS